MSPNVGHLASGLMTGELVLQPVRDRKIGSVKVR